MSSYSFASNCIMVMHLQLVNELRELDININAAEAEMQSRKNVKARQEKELKAMRSTERVLLLQLLGRVHLCFLNCM